MQGRRLIPVLALAVAPVMLLALPAVAQGFDPERATDAYLATVSGAARDRSDAYFEGRYWLQPLGVLVSILAAWVVLRTGLAARLRTWAEARVRNRFLSAFLLLVPLLLVLSALQFPFEVYEGFVREHSFGLSNQGFGAWAAEYWLQAAINAVLSGLFLAVLYLLIRRTGARWWMWGGGLAVLFLTVSLTLFPVFVAPLFNSYTPLPEGPLRDRVVAMAQANGVPAAEVWLVDQSRQSKRISANVSGMFGTTRISLNDNLLARGDEAEVAAVMAHEIGHYVLNHSVTLVAGFGAIIAAGFFAVAGGLDRLARGGRWGLRGVDDPAGAPMLLSLMSLWFVLMTPVTNSMIRAHEAEADIFGLNAAGEPDGFARIALKLGEYRKLDPAAWEEAIFYDHPSGRSRIMMAMRWKAAHLPPEPPQVQVGEIRIGD